MPTVVSMRLSILSFSVISSLVIPAYSAETGKKTQLAPVVVNGAQTSAQSYTVSQTHFGTGFDLTPRDNPQTVSVMTQARMQDQNLQSVGDVLNQTTGVSAIQNDSNRTDYYSRGFYIDNFIFDGLPTSTQAAWNYGDSDLDSAIYQRIEVIRGAAGLMTGAANPSAAVNMVRKKATSGVPTANITASYGQWANKRTVVDASFPLSQSGHIRGRVIAGYQSNNAQLARYYFRKRFIYGVINADLTDQTRASLGYIFQQSSPRSVTWGDFPANDSNGDPIHWDRSFNSSADWTTRYLNTNKIVASITHDLNRHWTFKLNGAHSQTQMDSKLIYFTNAPQAGSLDQVNGYSGHFLAKRTLDAIHGTLNGQFNGLGRQHELVIGSTMSRQTNHTLSSNTTQTPAQIGSLKQWDGSLAEPHWPDYTDAGKQTTRQASGYSALRLSITDPLTVIIGTRYNIWTLDSSSASLRKTHVSPYAGLVYDLNQNWSYYASYSDVFKPQTKRTLNKHYLSPIVGKSYETGLKAQWLNGQVNASASLFRIEQDNLGITDNTYIPGTTEYAYQASHGVISQGFEAEINGALTQSVQMNLGLTHYTAHDQDDAPLNPQLPRTTIKMFARYTPESMQHLVLGAGANWQSSTHNGQDKSRVSQGSVVLVNLLGRYQLSEHITGQINVKNLFDKTYYSNLSSGYAGYGPSRQASISLTYHM